MNLERRKIGREIGEIQFYIKEYDLDDDSSELKLRKLAKRPCTLEDMNGETSYGFIPGADAETQKFYTESLSNNSLWCIDEEYEIFGDYDSPKFHNLMVIF